MTEIGPKRYLSTSGGTVHRPDLVADADWLAAMLAELMPNEPEVAGLLAMIRLHRARAAARFDTHDQWSGAEPLLVHRAAVSGPAEGQPS